MPEGRAFVLDRVVNERTIGPTLVAPVRELAEAVGPEDLASYLVGGLLNRDLQLPETHGASLLWRHLRPDDFILTPLPNHLFQRDNSAWVYGGVSVNPMAKPARKRETVHSGPSTTSTRGSPRPRTTSSSTTATMTWPTSPPPAKAAT